MPAGVLDIPEGYGQATLQWSITGRSNPYSVTHGYHGTIAVRDPSESAEAIADAWTQENCFCDGGKMNVGWTFLGVTVHQKVDGVIEGGAAARSVAGTRVITGQQMITSSTLVVSKRTALVGRHYRGRMYVPFMLNDESGIDMFGTLDSGSKIIAQAAAGLVLSGLADEGLDMVLLHYGVDVGPTIPPTIVTSLTVANRVGTQRRRIR